MFGITDNSDKWNTLIKCPDIRVDKLIVQIVRSNKIRRRRVVFRAYREWTESCPWSYLHRWPRCMPKCSFLYGSLLGAWACSANSRGGASPIYTFDVQSIQLLIDYLIARTDKCLGVIDVHHRGGLVRFGSVRRWVEWGHCGISFINLSCCQIHSYWLQTSFGLIADGTESSSWSDLHRNIQDVCRMVPSRVFESLLLGRGPLLAISYSAACLRCPWSSVFVSLQTAKLMDPQLEGAFVRRKLTTVSIHSDRCSSCQSAPIVTAIIYKGIN